MLNDKRICMFVLFEYLKKSLKFKKMFIVIIYNDKSFVKYIFKICNVKWFFILRVFINI